MASFDVLFQGHPFLASSIDEGCRSLVCFESVMSVTLCSELHSMPSSLIFQILDFSNGQFVLCTCLIWQSRFLQKITRDAEGLVTGLEGDLHLEGDFKKTKWKLTWLPVVDELVPLTLVDFDYLISKKKLEEGDEFQSFVKSDTRKEKAAWGDPNMRVLKKGDLLQLERKGYYIVDCADEPIVMFNIPDGRQKKWEHQHVGAKDAVGCQWFAFTNCFWACEANLTVSLHSPSP